MPRAPARPFAFLVLACAFSSAAFGAESGRAALAVTWEGPEPLRTQLQKLLPPPNAQLDAERRASLRPWIRDVRRRVPEIAAAEGYFSASVEVELDEERHGAHVKVVPGARTTVTAVEIEFEGDLAGEGDGRPERRTALRESWGLAVGKPFRSADWDDAKNRLQEKLAEEDYAAGRLAESHAEVDADAASAKLSVKLASGPRFTLGNTQVTGLQHYSVAIVGRMNPLKDGERFRLARLLDLQHALQSGPWFSSVTVDVDRDPANAERVPVKVAITERPRREVGLALGYGTDAGARAEVAYRDRDLFGRALDLQSAVQVDRDRQIGYADIYLPPGLLRGGARDIPIKDSVGVLAEHTSIEGLVTRRVALAGYRLFTREPYELRAGLSYQVERILPDGSDEQLNRALAPVVAATWRHVDDLFDPTLGGVLNVQLAGGTRSLLSTQDFFKAYGQFQMWIPLGARDQILGRAELGRTFANSRQGIPEDFLFRAGGSRSLRGYAYQSLGPQEGNAIVGGRYLATASVDYVHWLTAQWGGALFFDAGNAADSVADWKAVKDYGFGARYKTPAGPLAIDIAYADRDRKFRVAFSVTVAF